MNGLLIGQITPLGHLDGIDLTDEIGDGDVRGRQLLSVALITRQPANLQVVSAFGRQATTWRGEGRERILRNLGVANDRYVLVEQGDETADDTRLRLAAFAEKHH